jgi:hypothetical protein
VWVIETKTGRTLAEHRPPEPWASAPALITEPFEGNRGFVAATTNRKIRAFAAHKTQAGPLWVYEGASSEANSPPEFWSEGEELLMLMDGDTLVKLAPENGKTHWFARLQSAFREDAPNSIILEAPHVYAAESSTLSCLRLKDGSSAWQLPLPHSSAWLLRKAGPFLMAAPFRSDDPDGCALVIHAETGKPVQRLNLPPDVTEMVFRPEGCLVATKEKLLGWGPMH